MYADRVTDSMRAAIDETERRRRVQNEYNEKHGITPATIKKKVADLIDLGKKDELQRSLSPKNKKNLSPAEREKLIETLTHEMRSASARLEFERAAYLRDRIKELRVTK